MAYTLPPLPLIQRGIRPFECCRLGNSTTDESVEVFTRERDSASRFVRLPAGTSVVADSANLHTIAWGIIVLQETADIHRYIESAADTLPFYPDSSFFVNRGDTVIHAGHVPEFGLLQPGLLVQSLREEWWVHIRFGARSGWIDAYHSKVRGSDACE